MNNPLSASENTTRNVRASHRGHPAYGNLPPEYLPFLVPHGSGEDLELEFDYEGFLKAQGARKDQEMGGMQQMLGHREMKLKQMQKLTERSP
ncbi:hypothetical protein NUW54_g13969 [Trametes sanguinea]|uniref:Uncharacterized protein n=1 Tax=Trametes sanguinea TaxID=158606 RepID=A0ACC1MFT1_9APHY|nr:hypothetical protein NUW54_g13969 [Trametes sanguinea]